MREVKFQAWDKVDKIMRTVTRLTFALPCSGHAAFLVHCDDGTADPVTGSCEPDGRFILREFIDFYDEDNTEIYEDDIVQSFDEYDGGKTEYRHVVSRGDVGWYPFSTYCHGGEQSWEVYKYRVIGNIHANPEIKVTS